MKRLKQYGIPPDLKYKDMPAGLEGYWWETEHELWIPWVASENPHAFVKFLMQCEKKGKAVIFPTVINERLAVLLQRRNYQSAMFWAGEPYNEYADCLVLNGEFEI